jgi:hypothetical protein
LIILDIILDTRHSKPFRDIEHLLTYSRQALVAWPACPLDRSALPGLLAAELDRASAADAAGYGPLHWLVLLGGEPQGSATSSRCTSAHPPHTEFAKRFGAAIPEPRMRPNPRRRARHRRARGLAPRRRRRPAGRHRPSAAAALRQPSRFACAFACAFAWPQPCGVTAAPQLPTPRRAPGGRGGSGCGSSSSARPPMTTTRRSAPAPALAPQSCFLAPRRAIRQVGVGPLDGAI